MRAIVTGGTGFIGKSLVKRLKKERWKIYVVTRYEGKAKRVLGEDINELVWDKTPYFPEADVIFNIAGEIRGRKYEDFKKGNVDFVRQVLNKSKGKAEKFVHLSSLAAAGPSPECEPLDETAESPISLYGRSKLEGERVVKENADHWVILRPSAVFGPGDMAFLELFRVIKRGFVPLVNEQILSMVFVEDLTEAIINSLNVSENEVFNVCGKEPISYWDFALKVAEKIGVRKVRKLRIPYSLAVAAAFLSQTFSPGSMFHVDKVREGKEKCWIATPEKAFKYGLFTETPLDEAIALTIQWYRERGLI